jgi:hypothetical protein
MAEKIFWDTVIALESKAVLKGVITYPLSRGVYASDREPFHDDGYVLCFLQGADGDFGNVEVSVGAFIACNEAVMDVMDAYINSALISQDSMMCYISNSGLTVNQFCFLEGSDPPYVSEAQGGFIMAGTAAYKAVPAYMKAIDVAEDVVDAYLMGVYVAVDMQRCHIESLAFEIEKYHQAYIQS